MTEAERARQRQWRKNHPGKVADQTRMRLRRRYLADFIKHLNYPNDDETGGSDYLPKNYNDRKFPNSRPVNLYRVRIDGKEQLLSAFDACYERIMSTKTVILLDEKPAKVVYESKSCVDNTKDEQEFLSNLLREPNTEV